MPVYRMIHQVTGMEHGLVTVDHAGLVAGYEATEGAPAADPPIEWEFGLPFEGFAASRGTFRFDPVDV